MVTKYTVVISNLDCNVVCANVYDTFNEACEMADALQNNEVLRAYILKDNVMDFKDDQLKFTPSSLVIGDTVDVGGGWCYANDLKISPVK